MRSITQIPELRRRIRVAVGVLALVGAAVLVLTAVRPRLPRAAAEPPAWREPMPEFTLPDLDGRPWSLSEHRGKVVLMNFWATWCPQSRYEAPGLVRVSDRFAERGLDTVGISLDRGDPLHVREWVSRYQIRYPILIPPEHSPVLSGVSLPLTILIDRQGRVAHRYYGTVTEAELSAAIERLLGER
jgi:cytochrome c biogenesis protein CcmG/thiol:disulfide interchange protein DsbE